MHFPMYGVFCYYIIDKLTFICLHVQLEGGQSSMVAVSDSSDLSKDKTGDQKVMMDLLHF